jgi:hypothetical protein
MIGHGLQVKFSSNNPDVEAEVKAREVEELANKRVAMAVA